MSKNTKLMFLEIKIQFYEILANYYKCKVLKHSYYMDQAQKYNNKVFNTEIEFRNMSEKKGL